MSIREAEILAIIETLEVLCDDLRKRIRGARLQLKAHRRMAADATKSTGISLTLTERDVEPVMDVLALRKLGIGDPWS